jgi:hypothetical protein
MNAFSTRSGLVSERRAADESAPGLRAQMTRGGDPARRFDLYKAATRSMSGIKT